MTAYKKLLSLSLLLASIINSCTNKRELTAEDIPDFMPSFEVVVNNGSFDGYIFLRKISDPGAQLMIDSEGKLVWFQLSDTTILRVYTPYKDSYLALHSKKRILEVTYDNDTLLDLSYGEMGFDRELHHEVIKDLDNNIIAITHEIIPLDLSEMGGETQDTVRTDGIIKLSRKGKKLWSWSLGDNMDPLFYPEINRYKKDWGHANSLLVDIDGNYVISWRDFNQVWKINSTSGEVMWKYGNETISNEQDRFYQQHSVNINLDGDYMVLDNGFASIRRSSRVLAFTVDEDTIHNTLAINLPDSMFTFKQGSAYQFSEDRYLISSTVRNLLVITDRKGEILWLTKTDTEFYRAYYLDQSVL